MKLWNRMPKGLRVALALMLTVVMVVTAWLVRGRPLPTFHTALRCVERQHLLGPGEVLLGEKDHNVYRTVALTDTHLRFVTLHRNHWLWSREGHIQSRPLNGELTMMTFYSFDHQLIVYTPLEGADTVRASLTVGEWTGQAESAVSNGACFLPVGLPDPLLENSVDLRNAYRNFCRQRAAGLDYTGDHPITLTVTIADEKGAVLTRLREEHPGT